MAQFEIREYEDIVSNIVSELISRNTSITDLNTTSIIRMLIESYALELNSEETEGIYQQIQNVYNSTRITTAVGVDLDELTALVGVIRRNGTRATTTLTLGRVTPTTTPIVIPQGVNLGTRPTIGEQLLYETTEEATLPTQILNENQDFMDGVFIYALNTRLVDSITSLTTASVTANTNQPSASVTSLSIEGTGYNFIPNYNGTLIDSSTLSLFDNCDFTTGWNITTDGVISQDNTINRQGTNSIFFNKSGTTLDNITLDRTITSGVIVSNRQFMLWLYIENNNLLTDLSNIEYMFGTDSSNNLSSIQDLNELELGWNLIVLEPTDMEVTGNINFNNIIYFSLKATYSNNDANNNLLGIDFINTVVTSNYVGSVIEFLQRPDESFLTTYVPLSVEVPVQSVSLGSNNNVGINNIVSKVSIIPDISSVNNYSEAVGGTDEEVDEDLRVRAVSSPNILSRATTSSIEGAVRSLVFINSASVIDLPITNVQNEQFTYSTSTTSYLLNNRQALVNDNTQLIVLKTSSLTSSITDTQTTNITLGNSSQLSSSGFLLIDNEILSYTSISSNILVGVTRGVQGTTATSHTTSVDVYQWFRPNIDYQITTANNVEFIGNAPNNSDVVTIDYDYREVGVFNLLYTPSTLTQTQIDELNTTINDFKSAGIVHRILTPVEIPINITADISITEGINEITEIENVRTIVTNTINNYGLGEDVYISDLYALITTITNVEFVTINTPSNNIIIGETEIAISGTIIINSI